MLVAPNVMDVERKLGLVPRDFRRWVALHEQTHRVQFAAANWLPDHLLGLMGRLIAAEADAAEGVPDLVGRLVSRQRPEHGSGVMLDLFTAPAGRDPLAEATAVMSLLEGHADVLMDLAGPDVVTTLPVIRARFESRRDQRGLTAMLGRLIGMDAKLAQYRDGASFCRAVLGRVGHRGLNAVFEAPDKMPLPDELGDPDRWIARVLHADPQNHGAA